MVQLENLTFRYHGQPQLFDRLNLRLDAGHIYGLLGKNGAGKTTLLKNIVGLAFPKSGNCTVNGIDSLKRLPGFLQQVFFLPEDPFLPDSSDKTFVGNICPFYPNFDHQQFERHLEVFDVPPQKTLARLSLGQQKKFLIAFALACNTPLLVMDEPTNGLDIPSKAQFRKVMASVFDESRCVIISTHQVRDLDNLIDTVVVLHERQVMLHANLDDLATQVLFGTIASTEVAHALYCEETFGGVRAIMANPDNIQSKPDLELLFNAVTKRHAPFLDHLRITN